MQGPHIVISTLFIYLFIFATKSKFMIKSDILQLNNFVSKSGVVTFYNK